ncbi:MAG: hypothetical protein KJ587_04470 [Alphaproteobacteria bacterium]|nr:hypothetical protein [Alphaproteobacteria bacterium]
MDNHPHHTTPQHRVTALFGDHEQSFDLVGGTTLAQLAERLAGLAQQNHGWPVGISVVFDTAPEVSIEAYPGATHRNAPAGQNR